MLTNQQIDKLSDLFMDLAKGLLLGGFAIQAITRSDIFFIIRSFGVAVFCVYFSLKILELKKGQENDTY